ncbi:MAG: rRNA maturation RNase YbeY [Anaerotignum sp.]|nr:rRNA maturation RNase YbeY [Anaerotignum sp.]MBQ7102626.1 rRNA maturation RNase YbeY [Anaerotignum sp.]
MKEWHIPNRRKLRRQNCRPLRRKKTERKKTVNLLIDNRTEELLTPELEEAIRKAAAESLKYEEFDENCEISVSIVDNEEIRQINKQFRNIDRATDVLSFPMLTFEEGEEAEVNENDEIILGDIIISLERAREQAEEYGHSLKREVAFLTAHSMLHLLGYDHMEPEEEAEMFGRQKEILLNAGFPRE